jgi:hypothetical protein
MFSWPPGTSLQSFVQRLKLAEQSLVWLSTQCTKETLLAEPGPFLLKFKILQRMATSHWRSLLAERFGYKNTLATKSLSYAYTSRSEPSSRGRLPFNPRNGFPSRCRARRRLTNAAQWFIVNHRQRGGGE